MQRVKIESLRQVGKISSRKQLQIFHFACWLLVASPLGLRSQLAANCSLIIADLSNRLTALRSHNRVDHVLAAGMIWLEFQPDVGGGKRFCSLSQFLLNAR